MKLFSLVRTTMLVLSVHSSVLAQAPATPSEAPPAPSPAPAIGSDVVRLRDGAVYRGTLVEQVPQSHVTIVTFGGEAKRFAASDVEYAGPLASQPAPVAAPAPAPVVAVSAPAAPAPAAEPAPAAGSVRLTLRPPPNFSFYLDDGSGLKSPCFGECQTDVKPGPYRFALGSDTRPPVVAPQTFQISTDDQVDGSFKSRRGARIAGGVIMAAGMVAGLGFLGAGVKARRNAENVNNACQDVDCGNIHVTAGRGAMVFGSILMAAGAVVGAVLLPQKDQAFVHPRSSGQAQAKQAEAVADASSVPNEDPDQAVLEPLEPKARACWNAESGRAAVRIAVGADGRVASVDIVSDASDAIQACLEGVVRGAQFAPGAPRTLTKSYSVKH